jgi:N-acetylmuramoyl-L-alanine amidase
MTRALGLKLTKVVIDPGHGGHDTGTIGPKGLTEKALVLDIAKRLGALIEERLGAEVVYTRTSDTFVPLEERTAIANAERADLFISLHANSSPVRTTSGVETYYLNFTSSKESLEVAARENASSQKSIHELRDLLQKIALSDKIEESRELATRVQNAQHALAAKANPKLRNRGVKKAPFVVLIGASMPSILTEVGFLSNPRDEALFNRPDHRQKVAEAIFKGISQYVDSLSHFQTIRKSAAAIK